MPPKRATRSRVVITELPSDLTNPVAVAVWRSCITEVQALKPGNVNIYSDAHGMRVDDFVRSARCLAHALGAPGLKVGERVLQGVRSTLEAVGCNTNLGIALVCAPLAHAVLESPPTRGLRPRVASVLAGLDRQDTDQVFRAIRLAEPAGLGRSPRHDIFEPATANLIEVMGEAQHRDRIAFQYVTDFSDIFEVGLPALRQELMRCPTEEWAAVGVYLTFLSRFPDTHICRKLGLGAGERVRREGERLRTLYMSGREPEQVVEQLLEFDEHLKQRGVNPGTSADLTVGTLLARRLQMLQEEDFCGLESLADSKPLPTSGRP